jgi:pantoate--beta-alanine ligase
MEHSQAMNIVSDCHSLRQLRKTYTTQSIGFVPTMGNLHAGHASLFTRASAENNIVIASIFINPTQFNQTSDFATYPKTLDADIALLEQLKVDCLFLPTADELYADHYQIQIQETELSQELEGAFRPGHFSGMLTVVLKLLNLTQPHHAYFGEKDFQQFLLVKKMAAALFLPTTIIPCPTIRAADGLALSSRNSRLTEQDRITAALLPNLLQNIEDVECVKQQLIQAGFTVEYVANRWQRKLAAVWLGSVRLIDNVPL